MGELICGKDSYNGADVSFVGRPFPLEEADEHFSRLASWGQKFLRLLVTWESIEHEGPGIYDIEYLDYLEGIVEVVARNGISLFIDPHQDVWSRWTGGDGAPMWTLEAVGFDPSKLHESGAALLHQEMGALYPENVMVFQSSTAWLRYDVYPVLCRKRLCARYYC